MENNARCDDATETPPDFFDQICEEVASSAREGKSFAPGAIEMTLPGRPRRTR